MLDRTSAQSRRQIRGRRQANPLAQPRERFRGSENVCLKFPASPLLQIALQFTMLKQFTQISRRGLVGLSPAKLSIDSQGVTSTGHGHIKQASLFLIANFLLIQISQP